MCASPSRRAAPTRSSPKALRASAGAIFRVPPDSGTTPRADGSPLSHTAVCGSTIRPRPPVTILLGAERDGLPDEIETTSHSVSIPLPGDAESLNVAAAGAIAMYEASRRGGS